MFVDTLDEPHSSMFFVTGWLASIFVNCSVVKAPEVNARLAAVKLIVPLPEPVPPNCNVWSCGRVTLIELTLLVPHGLLLIWVSFVASDKSTVVSWLMPAN